MALNLAQQQAKIQKEIGKLQKKAEDLRTKRRKPVIAGILQTMREYGVTIEELTSNLRKGKAAGGKKTAASKSATKTVAPKYRHPGTGETWSGRGKTPRWLAAAMSTGQTRESFLIASGSAA